MEAVQKHGPDDRFTVNAMWEVAQRLDHAGRQGEALILRQQIVERMRAHLGEEDLETLSAEQRLAASLMKNHRSPEARPLLEHVVRQRTRLLGCDHPQTVSAMQWLDRAQGQAGDQ
ncbi:MAG TPA: tetratricopeptide repeat protein [Acidimicrobiales bacterium]|nr:tetratricopeptide repeat protein [Acidimicrobiales bacterium]